MALRGHPLFTADYMGWAGIQNGKVLRLVEEGGFDIFITADKKMRGQQNFVGRPFAMVYLTAQEWSIISSRVPAIMTAIEAAAPGSFQVVACGEFRR
jgi:hypothetical protein